MKEGFSSLLKNKQFKVVNRIKLLIREQSMIQIKLIRSAIIKNKCYEIKIFNQVQ